MQKLKGELMLFIAAVIWGISFLFQKVGMDYIGPLTFTMFRFGIGSLAILPVVWFNSRRHRSAGSAAVCIESEDHINEQINGNTPFTDRRLITGGIFIGAANFAGSVLQQIVIAYTTVGKAGFLTAMDLVFVPFILVIIHQKVHPLTWTGVVVACIGMYCLSITGGFHMSAGDLLCLGGAFGFAVQIVLINYYTEHVDCIKLAFYEFAVTFILSAIFTPVFEHVDMCMVIKCAGPLLFTGVMEVCVAFTLEIVALKYAPPAIGTIIMSMESVFAALAGFLFLKELMTKRQTAGCVIMLIAFIIAQIPEMKDDADARKE